LPFVFARLGAEVADGVSSRRAGAGHESANMPSTPITSATDLTLPFIPPTLTWHNFVTLTPPLAGIALCFELPVTVMWPPGRALDQNKLSDTVLHRMLPIALDGHDCGHMIPHVTIPPAPLNVLLPLHLLFSSRKMIFASGIVKANGARVACQLMGLLPMSCCADPVALPTGSTTNITNSVEVGLTWTDVLVGALELACGLLLDAVLRSKVEAPKLDWKSLLEQLGVTLALPAAKDVLKKAAHGLVSGCARILVTDENRLSIKLGNGYVNAGLGFAVTTDGTWSVSASGQVGAPVGLGGAAAMQGNLEYQKSPDGSRQYTHSRRSSAGQPAVVGGGAARHSQSSRTTIDAQGRHSTEESSETEVVEAEPGQGYRRTSRTTSTKPQGKPSTEASHSEHAGHLFEETWGAPL
jgi:hypothetical protein